MIPADDGHQGRARAETSALPADRLAEPQASRRGVDHDSAPELEEPPGGAALLIVRRGPNAGARFEVDGVWTSVGRHPDSDVVLDDITVSRRHAEFRRDGGQFSVVDVGSLNGTYVNGRPVDAAVLTNGDQVQIGNFRLTFLCRPAAQIR